MSSSLALICILYEILTGVILCGWGLQCIWNVVIAMLVVGIIVLEVLQLVYETSYSVVSRPSSSFVNTRRLFPLHPHQQPWLHVPCPRLPLTFPCRAGEPEHVEDQQTLHISLGPWAPTFSYFSSWSRPRLCRALHVRDSDAPVLGAYPCLQPALKMMSGRVQYAQWNPPTLPWAQCFLPSSLSWSCSS